jgi:undecaprenyl pyrophosphate phosphatase UppP
MRTLIKLAFAVLPALVLGKLFDDKINAILGNPIPIAIVLVLGGVVLLFFDKVFKVHTVHNEKEISIKKAIIIFWVLFSSILSWFFWLIEQFVKIRIGNNPS